MPKDDDTLLTDFAKVVWGKRAEGLPVPELRLDSEIGPQEMENLKLRSAFVQILNPKKVDEFEAAKLVKPQTGWIIIDYRCALSASAGDELPSHGKYTREADGSLIRLCTGKGTLIKQIVDTATEMVRLVHDRGWDVVHMVDGHPLMMWAIWKACQELQILVSGYVPSLEEEEKYRRIKRYCANTLLMQSEKPAVKPQF